MQSHLLYPTFSSSVDQCVSAAQARPAVCVGEMVQLSSSSFSSTALEPAKAVLLPTGKKNKTTIT